jgi:nonsense-mediated mRNA decay protein 3
LVREVKNKETSYPSTKLLFPTMQATTTTTQQPPTTFTLPTVLCCICGTSMQANAANMCATCLQSRHDVTRDLEKEVVIVQCKRCEKWLKEDGTWTRCDPESKELLSYCLRRIGGIKNVRLVDASFVWTEPHSRRIKVKVKVQAEVERTVVLQQATVVEYIVRTQMCHECHRGEAKQDWTAVVQVRQKVKHKRTFLFLEQLILKHHAQEKAVRIEPMPEGVDFYFASKTDAAKFVSFLDSTVPMKSKQAEKLMSADVKSNESTYNYTFSVELAPICKDDLVLLPKTTAQHQGNINRLVLCTSVASTMRFIDFSSCKICELNSFQYFDKPFTPILDASRLTVFVVLDVQRLDEDGLVATNTNTNFTTSSDNNSLPSPNTLQPSSTTKPVHKRRRKVQQPITTSSSTSNSNNNNMPGSNRISNRHILCQVEIAREKDFGLNDDRIIIKSHLGHLLRPGDYALGYDLTTSNYNHDESTIVEGTFPDVILVRKHYPKLRSSKKKRAWRLKSIAAEEPDRPGYGMGVDEERHAPDMELFLRDLEEDEEMRDKVQLYKQKEQQQQQPRSSNNNNNSSTMTTSSSKKNTTTDDVVMMEQEEYDIEDDAPEIPLEQLMQEMELDDDNDQIQDDDDDGIDDNDL